MVHNTEGIDSEDRGISASKTAFLFGNPEGCSAKSAESAGICEDGFSMQNMNKREVFGVVRKSKSSLRTLAAVLFLLLVALVMRYLPSGESVFLAAVKVTVRSVIHVSLSVAWCISLHRRILNPQIRTILMTVGGLMVFWLVTKNVKYEFLAEITNPVGRYIWYSWYIPMLLIPLLGLFVVHHIGKPNDYRAPRKMFFLLIPAFLLIGLVLTNDFHQLVFRFDKGLAYYDKDYSYGLPYFVLMAWYVLLTLYFVISLLRKCRVPGSKQWQKLPLIIAFLGVVFWTVYVMKLISVDLTVIDCLIITSLLESAIQCGMIPSNTDYHGIFSITTVPLMIMDEDFQAHYVSGGALPLSEEDLARTRTGDVPLGDTLLRSAPIQAGRVVWQDDISVQNAIHRKLRDIREQLKEESTLLQAEVELTERKAKVDEKNRLYDLIAQDVAPQLIRAEDLLQRASAEPENARDYMAKICVIGCYIKRRGNLLLLGEENENIPAAELEHCIRESLENLRLGGVFTLLDSTCSDSLPVDCVVSVYDFYENVAERLLEKATAFLVNLNCDGGTVSMNLQIGCSAEITEQDFVGLTLRCGTFRYEVMEEDVVISLSMSRGGCK